MQVEGRNYTTLLKTWRPWIFEQKRWLKISCII